jgi:hypothetical protein
LASHQLPQALALTLGTSAAHKAAVVQEEAQQVRKRSGGITFLWTG